MEASRLLYASGVLAVATLGLIITCFIYGIGIAQYSELWALCIALWVLTNVSAFVTTVYVYDIKWDDSKMVSIMLALAGLFVVIVMLYVPISQASPRSNCTGIAIACIENSKGSGTAMNFHPTRKM